MKAKFRLVRCCCAGVLTIIVTAAMADALPRNVLTVEITPAMIRHASATPTTSTNATNSPPSKDQSLLFAKALQPHEVFRHLPPNLDRLPNGCAHKGSSLCFDYRSGHAVYKPMRKLLPDIPGMTPHNLSIRRGKIVARYTFK